MFHSMVKSGLSLAFLAALIGTNASIAAGQDAPKKPSLWQQMKDAAKQAQQQGKPQPQSQQQPGQRPGQQQRPGQSQGGGQINDSGPFKPPAGTKIEEKILAPVQQGARFTVSPHGVHVATISNSGSRAVVIYDGVEGPKFDEILNSREIAFSPDGNRYAYCARSGDQYVVMVDGKELVRSSESRDGRFDETTCKLGFTSNSKHVYYFSRVEASTPPTGFERFVFDGKPGIPNSISDGDPLAVAFSPDGDHFAYVWNDPHRQRPWTLIVDGKPAGYQGGAPQWTAESKHLYTQNRKGEATDLMFDGKPIARAFNFRVFIPPVGDMVVAAVSGGSLVKPVEFMVVAGKKILASEIPHDRGGIGQVVFSPDGKHYAAVYITTKNTRYVFTDGKPGEEYVLIDQLAFTADSSKLVYRANVNGKIFIVAGDQEFEGNIVAQVMSPVGNRVGGLLLGNGGSPSLLMDGKVTKLNIAGGDDLSFSPDGGHYAYFAVDASLGHRLVLDGIVQSESVLTKVDTMDLQNALALKYVFSPDGKHIAHFAGPPTPTGGYDRGIFLDGKYIPASAQGTNHNLSFSPDSNHLFWIHEYGNQPDRVFIDGKPLVEFLSAGMVPHWWEFGPDGTLSFLAQNDNSLKRITITLSPETSVATMLGGRNLAANK